MLGPTLYSSRRLHFTDAGPRFLHKGGFIEATSNRDARQHQQASDGIAAEPRALKFLSFFSDDNNYGLPTGKSACFAPQRLSWQSNHLGLKFYVRAPTSATFFVKRYSVARAIALEPFGRGGNINADAK